MFAAPLFSSSLDGATAADFHGKCDGKGATLTLIKDTDGYVFGGCTQQQWSSTGGGFKDPAAFLFTVVNPYDEEPALFASTGDGYSIFCQPSCGPVFGYGNGIHITEVFDAECYTNLTGGSYNNGTRHSATGLFTGARKFTPAVVEVWAV